MRGLAGVGAAAWLLLVLWAAPCGAVTVALRDGGSSSALRWLDVADQPYSAAFQAGFDYGNAGVAARVEFQDEAEVFAGTLTVAGLKPNFAYQIKIEGTPGGRTDNEWIGHAGRFWQEQWLGDRWGAGMNLNVQPDPNPAFNYPGLNPNDLIYLSRRDLVDSTGHPLYRYTGYLVLGYFITDAHGDATVPFRQTNSYHVLWKTQQRARDVLRDGPLVEARLEAAGSYLPFAYAAAGAETTVGLFGEWERQPRDGVMLPSGDYPVKFILTEECFHSGLALGGGYAKAMEGEIAFRLREEPPTVTFGALPTAVGPGRWPLVSVTFSEAVTGFTAEDIEVGNGTVTGFTGAGGDYGFVLVPAGLGAVTLRLPAGVAQDARGNPSLASAPVTVLCVPGNEPDDEPGQASPLANGVSQADSIHRAGNVDWFTIDLPAGPAAYALTVAGQGEGAGGVLSLFGPDRALTPVAGDGGTGPGTAAEIVCTAPRHALAPGVYSVRVAAAAGGGVSAYHLRASWTPYYAVTFSAAAGGSLAGPPSQLVLAGRATAPVTALPAAGFVFAGWSDGLAANPRIVVDVTANLALTARFRPAWPVLRDGTYMATVDAARARAGQGLWDVTGHYETSACGYPLHLDLVHDERGRVSGTGGLEVAASRIPLAVKGAVRGAGDALVLRLHAHGAGDLLWSQRPAEADLRLDLALEPPTGTLQGTAALDLAAEADALHAAAPCILALPGPMDGTLRLRLDLAFAGRRARGRGELILSNGAAYALAVRVGRVDGAAVRLVLAGAGTEPGRPGVRVGVVVTPLEDGTARLEAFRADLLGQDVAW